jgi:hypothetical protein
VTIFCWWENVRTTETKFKILKERFEALEGAIPSGSLEKSLTSIRENLSGIEATLYSQHMLSNILPTDPSHSLLTEASIRHIFSSLKTYNRELRSYLKIIKSLSSILKSSRRADMGEIRQNFYLSKIRKHFIAIEKLRIPVDSTISDLEEVISFLEAETGETFNASLSQALKKKKELHEVFAESSNISDITADYESELEKFTALMDFVSTNGDSGFCTENQTSTNFINHINAIKMEYKNND